jgi:hypothetical protein
VTPLTPTLPVAESIFVGVECVVRGSSTYEARFGYQNENDGPVTIAVGPDNRLSPDPAARGQPTTFAPGRVGTVFTVSGIPNGTNLVWLLTYGGATRTATASADYATACAGPPPAPPVPVPITPTVPPLPPPDPDGEPIGVFVDCVRNNGATYDAVFGYQNQSEDTVTIAAGSANGFRPAPVERGQVTEFLPGNVQQAFVVRGIARAATVTWGVTYEGTTRSATSSALHPTTCAEPAQPIPPGQPPEPIGIFACITRHGATFDVTFGYENDNNVAVTIPTGLRNSVAPDGPGRGQPTTFLPGRVANAFTVRGVPQSGAVAWTLWFRGLRGTVVTGAFPITCGGAEVARPVRPFALCVRHTGSTYTAVFGYVSLNRTDVIVPVGAGNQVATGGGSLLRRQPIVFRSGNTYAAVAVRGVPMGQTARWSVTTFGMAHTGTATSQTRPCLTTGVDPSFDVAIEKEARQQGAAVGSRIDYTLVVRNVGTSTAFLVQAIDRPLDDRIRLLSAAASRGRCALRDRDGPAQRVECIITGLAPGEAVTIVIGARAEAVGVARNSAVVRTLRNVLAQSTRALAQTLPLDPRRNNVDIARVRIVAGNAGMRPPFTG